MIEHLSSSQMNLYLQCSLKYKFRYIDKIPVPFKPSGLAFGSAIHSTLSWFHKERKKGNEVTLGDFLRLFDTDWYSQRADAKIRYKSGEDDAKLAVIAKEILALYFHQEHNGVADSEIPFVVPLVNPSNGDRLGLNLEGFIDLIEKDDTIVEFKTSNQTFTQKNVDDNLQLTAYSYAFEIIYQKPPKLIKIVDFVKTKKPKMIVLETKRNKHDYQRLFCLASQVLKGIQSQIFFPRTSFWCKDCEYGESCRKWGAN